jgi:hypothetical protein
MQFTKVSQASGLEHTRELPISYLEYEAWKYSGQFIQDYFPNLSADDREFLLTGVTPEEWNELFPPDEDYDPDEDNEAPF